MTALAPLSTEDVERIAADALGRLDLKASPTFGKGIAAELAESLRFDHDARQFVLVDAAGHPRVDVDHAGNVREVTLADHLRQLAQARPYAFSATTTAGGATEANPFLSGLSFSRTRQAQLKNADPEAAARLDAEAAKAEGRSNPWSKVGWNRTTQSLMRKSDPAMADRLASEAGVAVDAMRPL